MVIVCGVDDSAAAQRAAKAAAAVAKRADEALSLVHVQDVVLLDALLGADGMTPVPLTSRALLDAHREQVRGVLEPLRERLAREFGIAVDLRFDLGLPDRELARCAEELGASLIVVGAIGRRSGSMWRLGSVPDRLSQAAAVPVLVVRDPEPFERWAREPRALRVVLALGTGASSASAAEAAAALGRLGPVEFIEAHVYEPRREAQRLGLAHPDDPETRTIERALARELPERSGRAAAGSAHFIALPEDGHVAEALAAFAEKERADLIVAGAHGRGALERRFLGSVSYGLLGLSGASVLIARRLPSAARGPRAPATIRRILVATDFSEGGNRAVDHALGLLPPGGQLTLLHVLARPIAADMVLVPDPVRTGREERRMTRTLAQAELRGLVPPQEDDREVEAEVVEASSVSQGILQAAERHDADLVVLGRSGRGGLAAALVGSSARAVAQRCPRPVLLVPEASERD